MCVGAPPELFTRFTGDWQALLWGVNVGGFGSLAGSLANLIACKLYVDHYSTDDRPGVTIRFLLFGFAAFLIGIGRTSALPRHTEGPAS